MQFSEDIVKLLEEHYPGQDIYSMTLEELEAFKEEVEELREEYRLLEFAMKQLGNAAYGAAASQFFYFFNVKLAADITGECRNLTKTMWGKLEEWFHEDMWTRKDLWERFDFELDESKHDWYRKQPVSIYSDTDSVYTTYGTFFRCFTEECKKKYDTDRKKLDFILRYNQEFQDKLNTQWCEEMYNPRHGQSIHNFELETVSCSGIYLKKKKYCKALVFNKGKYLDAPKISGTGVDLIKSTTPKFCRKVLKDVLHDLILNYHDEDRKEYLLVFKEKISDYRKQFWKVDYESISQSIGIGAYKKYVIDDGAELLFEKKAPVSVKAIARYNHLAHKNNQDNLRTISGKIKYYNIKIGTNPKNATGDYFGYPSGELPEWRPEMDKLTQWKKTICTPINGFLEVMQLPLMEAAETTQLSLFDDEFFF